MVFLFHISHFTHLHTDPTSPLTLYTSCLLSAPSVPSSSKGCSAFNGRFGESSASPTSSNTTTETYLLVSTVFWKRFAVLKTSITLSEVESWLHWYENMWTCGRRKRERRQRWLMQVKKVEEKAEEELLKHHCPKWLHFFLLTLHHYVHNGKIESYSGTAIA